MLDRRRRAAAARTAAGARSASSRSVDVPPTIQALLAARLDRLAPEERAVIERGVRDRPGVLARRGRASSRRRGARPTSARTSQTLVRKELVRRRGASFAGEDGLPLQPHPDPRRRLRRCSRSARAELHERFADWLEDDARASAPASTRRSSATTSSRRYRYLAELGPLDERGRDARRARGASGSRGGPPRARARRHARRGEPARARLLAAGRGRPHAPRPRAQARHRARRVGPAHAREHAAERAARGRARQPLVRRLPRAEGRQRRCSSTTG